MRHGFCLWPQNKTAEFYMGWWDIPLAKEADIPKVPLQDHVDNFFSTLQDIVHEQYIPEGKTINAEFCKGIMDHLLKRIQRVCPPAFCFWDFLLLHNNAPAHKAASVLPIFDPKKCYNRLSLPVLSRFISARLFSVPQVENEVERTPLCGCWWDPRSHKWWIKEDPKRGIFGSFSENVRPHKSLYICQWSLFWI